MSAVAKAAIATELALLTKVQDFPVAPFGYGSDIRGASDLEPDLSEVDGFVTLALAEAIVRRLDCPRGALPDDKNYGIDVRSYVNRGTTVKDLRALGGQIRSEVLKDDRIEALTVIVTPNPTGSELRIELAVRPFATNGEFTLTLSATSAEILIEEIRAAA